MGKAEAITRLREMAKEAMAEADACYVRKDDQGYFICVGRSFAFEDAADLLEEEGE